MSDINAAPSLFDSPSEPTFIDAKPLGDVCEIVATDEYAVIIFEHGSIHIAASAFFSLSRTLSRVRTS